MLSGMVVSTSVSSRVRLVPRPFPATVIKTLCWDILSGSSWDCLRAGRLVAENPKIPNKHNGNKSLLLKCLGSRQGLTLPTPCQNLQTWTHLICKSAARCSRGAMWLIQRTPNL